MPEKNPHENNSSVETKSEDRHQEFLDQVLCANLDDFYKAVLDSMAAPVFIVEQDVRIVDFNAAAGNILARDKQSVVKQRAGDALRCLHSTDVAEGCGRGPSCTNCTIRNSVNQSLQGLSISRHKVKFETLAEGEKNAIDFLVTASPLEYADHKYVLLIMDSLAGITAAIEA